MTMKYLEWIIYFIYVLFFNLGWVLGCRSYARKNIGVHYGTIATTMLMSITTFIFAFDTSLNKLHLFWITPLLIFSSPVNLILFRIPLIGKIYLFIVKLFGILITLKSK